MDKKQALELLMLLSGLESWILAKECVLPDHLIVAIERYVEILSTQVLGG